MQILVVIFLTIIAIFGAISFIIYVIAAIKGRGLICELSFSSLNLNQLIIADAVMDEQESKALRQAARPAVVNILPPAAPARMSSPPASEKPIIPQMSSKDQSFEEKDK